MSKYKPMPAARFNETGARSALCLDDAILRDAATWHELMPRAQALILRRREIETALPSEFRHEGIDPRGIASWVGVSGKQVERWQRYQEAFLGLGLGVLNDELESLLERIGEIETRISQAVPATDSGALAIAKVLLSRGQFRVMREQGENSFDGALLATGMLSIRRLERSLRTKTQAGRSLAE